MNDTDDFLPLAAMAAAAMPDNDFVSLCSPRFETEDLRVCAVKDAAGRKWLVNCPRTQHRDEELQIQSRIMQALTHDGACLPFALPWPAHSVRIVGGKHALVHVAFPGRPLSQEDLTVSDKLAESLGSALASLHDLPVRILQAADRPAFSADQIRRRWLSLLDESAPTRAIPPRLWQRWEERLEDVSLWRFSPAFIHADLQEPYLYTEDEAITGITGFGDAQFGDPARDLAWVVSSSSDEFAKGVLDTYRKLRLSEDPKLNARIELNSELVLLEWLLHGVRENNEEIIADARELIAQLADTLDSTGLLPALREDFASKNADKLAESSTDNSPEPGESTAELAPEDGPTTDGDTPSTDCEDAQVDPSN
ncbi:phosphotransferase [Varibaculum prostatecancerukia]|uniref:phosphotransferase n=1 Tax=Varibaculum prostatecancerukia TaxID=2811781 RepID=UPI001BFFF30F|nr:phosphotransferase [Varibaculum prostatecancerukia]